MAVNSQLAFSPLGLTHALNAASTPPTAIQVDPLTQYEFQNVGQYFITNPGPEIVYLSYAQNQSEAETNAVQPTAGNPEGVMAIIPGSQVLRFARGTWFSAYCSSSQTIYIQNGQGL